MNLVAAVLLAATQIQLPAATGIAGQPVPGLTPGVRGSLLVTWDHSSGFDFYGGATGPFPLMRYSLTGPITPENWVLAVPVLSVQLGPTADSMIAQDLPAGRTMHFSLILQATRVHPITRVIESIVTQIPASSVLVTTPADQRPPSAIGDLRAELSDDRDDLDLVFTAPFNDAGDMNHPVRSYFAAFSTEEITPENAAALPRQEITPVGARLPFLEETRRIVNPCGDAGFWIVLFSGDEGGNLSPPSNILHFQAKGKAEPPVIAAPEGGSENTPCLGSAPEADDDKNGTSGAGVLVGVFATIALLRSRRPPPPSRS